MPPTQPDHYALLEVQPSAGVEQIKAAYLRQVLRWHPDRNPSDEATARTARINAAWEVLQDPKKRAAYDRKLGRSRSGQARRPSPTTARTPPTGRPPGRARSARPTRPSEAKPDPAVAERARRAAETSAREAEERRRREAEHERRRAAAAHLWEPPPDSGLGWGDRDFVVGNWYRNNRGPYKVVDVRDRFVDIYYADGELTTQRREDLWRHWQGQVEQRRRAARPARPARRYH